MYSSALRATLSAAVLLAGIGFASTAQAETCSIAFTVVKAGFVVGGQGGSGAMRCGDRTYRISIGGLSYGFMIGASETRFQSLLSGRMDAATLSLPHSVLAKQQGFRFLGTAGDVLHIPFIGFSTTTNKIQRDRDQVKRVIQAQMDAMRWIKNQKPEAIQFLRHFFGTDEPTAIESYNVYAPLIIDDVRVTAEAVRAILDAEGALNIPWTQVADASLVEEIVPRPR